jgi:hypothetical protein
MTEEKKERGMGLLGGGAALTGIAASPFLGMIGEDKITKDPYRNPNIRKYTGLELEQMSRPGDVVVTAQPNWGKGHYKATQALSTGSDFYHAEPVYNKKRGRRTSITVGQFTDPYWNTPGEPRTPRDMESHLSPFAEKFKDEDMVLLRPKEGLTPKQIRDYQKNMVTRSRGRYDSSKNVGNYLRDLFVPKIKGKSTPTCKGDVCATFPAQAMAEAKGKRIHPHKKPAQTMPADLLRSQSIYDAVGATDKYKPLFKNPNLVRALTRGGLGLGMAGTAYGAYQEPEIATGAIGAVAAPMLAEQARIKWLKRQHPDAPIQDIVSNARADVPRLLDLVDNIGAPDAAHISRLRKNFMRRTVPIALLGGLGTYGLAKAIDPEPESYAAAAGMAAMPTLAQKLRVKMQRKKYPTARYRDIVGHGKIDMPNISDIALTMGSKGDIAQKMRKNFLRRSVPLALLGGLGAYGAAKGARKGIGLLRGKSDEKE